MNLGSQQTTSSRNVNTSGRIEKVLNSSITDQAELDERLMALQDYYNRLKELGVNVPDTSFEIRQTSGKSEILISSQFIPGTTVLDSVLKSSDSEFFQLVHKLLEQTDRIILSLTKSGGVGYDVALHNFILSHDDNCIYSVDLTPPRPTTCLGPLGELQEIPYQQLLVNYPEAPPLSPPEYEDTLRRFYYTPSGTLLHLYAWLVATRFHKDDGILKGGWWRHDTQQLFDALCNGMYQTDLGTGIVNEALAEIITGNLDQFITRRICKQRGETPPEWQPNSWFNKLKYPRG